MVNYKTSLTCYHEWIQIAQLSLFGHWIWLWIFDKQFDVIVSMHRLYLTNPINPSDVWSFPCNHQLSCRSSSFLAFLEHYQTSTHHLTSFSRNKQTRNLNKSLILANDFTIRFLFSEGMIFVSRLTLLPYILCQSVICETILDSWHQFDIRNN